MEYVYLATIGTTEWIIILLIVLVLFGATKIPKLMRGFGQGVGEFKKGLKEGEPDQAQQTQPPQQNKQGSNNTPNKT